MLRRLIVGLVFGLVIGGALAFGLVRLGTTAFAESGGGEAMAYLASAVAGALTGAVAGKPIWASGAKIEAGLKALFGAMLAIGAMFAVRRWAGGIPVPDMSAIGGGNAGTLAREPLASIPLIAGVLGGLLGLDNTDDPQKDSAPRARKRVAAAAAPPGAKTRVAEADDAEDPEPSARRAKR